MTSWAFYRAIDLTGGFYQIVMNECNILLTVIRTPRGALHSTGWYFTC
ncbi:hypothetical protein F441_11696 [Phytophthora nicotianae CJ01A1]|uniref:Reverse transcriptase domain-containing protein n=2 Tax=Phytophthora nicotianae TaxID=4792 RepID=W2WR66_PHYNI|nr:hypothetical protein L916_11358 [Phytophthora nicotianae]ETP13026.1 hypothetical protein F441_11696 [Phytophthora nicotianae CJ01A1]